MDEYRFDQRRNMRVLLPDDDPNSNETIEEEVLTEDENLSEDDLLLGLFEGHKMPNHEIAWRFYRKGLDFNSQIKLEETVKVNENFFIGSAA